MNWTFLATGALAIVAGAATPSAATLRVGPGEPYTRPSAAAGAVSNGDTVLIAAGTYTDCAVWQASNITVVGAGADKTLIGDTSCQGKGVFVVYGNNVTIQDVTLRGALVPDQNGAA